MSDRQKLIRAWYAVIIAGILLALMTTLFVDSPAGWVFLAVQLVCICVAIYYVQILRRNS